MGTQVWDLDAMMAGPKPAASAPAYDLDALLTEELPTDRPPWEDSAFDIEGSPEGQARSSAQLHAVGDPIARLAKVVGDKLQAVRRQTVDPVARFATRTAGVATPDVVDPETGKPRPVTAPELLEQGLFPPREAGGRATSKDYVRAAVEMTGISKIPGMPSAETIVTTMPDFAVKLLGGPPGALGDLDELVARNPSFARKAKVAEDLTRVGVRTGAGLVTDPLSAGGAMSVTRALAGGAKALQAASRVDQALTATGAALGTVGAAQAAGKAHADFVKGDIDAMLVDLAEMGTAGTMGVLARKGYKEIATARSARRAAVDTGRGYEADPALTAAERAPITEANAADAAAAERAAVAPGQQAMAQIAAANEAYTAGAGKPAPPVEGRIGAATVEPETPPVEVADEGLTNISRDDVRLSPRALEVAKEQGASQRLVPTDTRAAMREKLGEIIERRKADAARAVASQDAAAAQRAAVAEAEAGVGRGHDAGRRVAERAVTAADAYSHIENLPKVGKELAGRHRAAEEAKETIAGALKAPTRGALSALGKTEKAQAARFAAEVAPALDGKADPAALAPDARAVYDVYRAKMDEAFAAYNAARESAGMEPLAREEAYFPRVAEGESLLDIESQAAQIAHDKSIPLEEAMRQLRGSDLVIASRTDRRGAFEQTRTGDLANARHDPGVVADYFDVLARRTAELTHYGKNGEKVAALIAQLPDSPVVVPESMRQRLGLPNSKYKVGDREFAQLFFDRTRNVVPTGLGTQVGHIVRTLSGLHDLVWSAPRQVESIAQTAMAGGVRGAAKGVWQTVAGEVRASDMRSPRRLATAIGNSIRKVGLDAERAAATSHHVTADLMNASMTANAKPPFWIRAMLAADRGQRYAAVKTWEAVGSDLIAKAKAGNAAEARNLDRIGIDWKGIDVGDAAAMDLAAKRFSDATQYRASIGTLPPWASSPGGRMAFQYLSFINAHTKTMKYVASETAKGNVKPAARFLAVGLPIALANNQIIDALKGYGYTDKQIKDDDFAKTLADALKGKVSVNPTAGRNEALIALARGVSSLGVGMVYQAMLERGGSGEVADLLPAGKYIKGAEDVIGGRDEESRGRSAAKLAVSLVPSLPGVDLLREAAAGKKSIRPGWGGRLRDVLEDRGILPSDPETGGSAGRQRLVTQADVAARRTSANKEAADLAAPHARKPIDARMSEAARTARKAELVVVMAKALRDRDQVARLAAIVEARRIRRPFSRKTIAELQGRVYHPQVEGDDDVTEE